MRDTIASGKGLARGFLPVFVDGDARRAPGAVAAAPDQGARSSIAEGGRLQPDEAVSLLQPDVVSAITMRARARHERDRPRLPHWSHQSVEAGMDHVAHPPINGDPQSPQTRATIELLARKNVTIRRCRNELLGHAPRHARKLRTRLRAHRRRSRTIAA
jgi:hypothetical protein